MVRKHEDVRPLPPVPCPAPCPKPPTPIIPVVSVSSVNGETGDVVLKNLIIGEQEYNGSDEIQITLEDLDLDTAVVWRGAVNVKEDLDYIKLETGDLYFCKKDKLLYLCIDRDNRTWVNIRITLTDEDIRSISFVGEKQEVDETGNIDIPAASEKDYGLVKFSELFGARPSDGCMVMNFENIMKGSIDVDKLKGDLWLKADTSVEKPDDLRS